MSRELRVLLPGGFALTETLSVSPPTASGDEGGAAGVGVLDGKKKSHLRHLQILNRSNYDYLFNLDYQIIIKHLKFLSTTIT